MCSIQIIWHSIWHISILLVRPKCALGKSQIILQLCSSSCKSFIWTRSMQTRNIPCFSSCKMQTQLLVEDASLVCVCQHYSLLTWKQTNVYHNFKRKCIEIFVICCSKQYTVICLHLHCISQIWQIIHFHSAHKGKCYLTVKK